MYTLNKPDKMVKASLREINQDINYVVIEMQGVAQKFSLVVDTDCETLIYLSHVPDSGPVGWLEAGAKVEREWPAWDLTKLNGREILVLQTELSRRVVNVVRDEVLRELS